MQPNVNLNSDELLKNSMRLIKRITLVLAASVVFGTIVILLCNFIALGANNKQEDNSNTSTVRNSLWTGTLLFIASIIFIFASLWVPVTTLYSILKQFLTDNPKFLQYISPLSRYPPSSTVPMPATPSMP